MVEGVAHRTGASAAGEEYLGGVLGGWELQGSSEGVGGEECDPGVEALSEVGAEGRADVASPVLAVIERS